MKWLLGLVVVMPLVLLVVGSVRGRVRLRSCCALDAAHDSRMTAAAEPVGGDRSVRGDRAAS